LKEKTELPKLQAEKEAVFKEGCKKIEDTMQCIRVALEACMTGDISGVEVLLHKTHAAKHIRDIFFQINPLHIAAEYNHASIIPILGLYGVNFTRFNNAGEQAIDLAEIQGNKEARKALIALEMKTKAVWLALEQEGEEGRMALQIALSEGVDLGAV